MQQPRVCISDFGEQRYRLATGGRDGGRSKHSTGASGFWDTPWQCVVEGWQLWDSGKGAYMEADAGVLPLMVAPTEAARAGTITSHLYIAVYHISFSSPAEAQPGKAWGQGVAALGHFPREIPSFALTRSHLGTREGRHCPTQVRVRTERAGWNSLTPLHGVPDEIIR